MKNNKNIEQWLRELETIDVVGRNSFDNNEYVCEAKAKYGDASDEEREDFFSLN